MRHCPDCGLSFTRLGSHRCIDHGPPPPCECGCGEPVKSIQNGVWSRYRAGHQLRVHR